MNYELAKQLKDAGFPQKENKEEKYVGKFGEREYVYYPTLEELIEACGGKLGSITNCLGDKSSKAPRGEDGQRIIGGWEAISSNDEEHGFEWGSTPLEAVANLWLALNKKQ